MHTTSFASFARAAALLLGATLATHSPRAAPAAPAQESAPLERPGDGRATCGLGKEFHAGRRAALRASLGSGLVLVRGLPATRDYSAFRQDKVFWYLTGIETPGAALLMDASRGLEVLFVSEPNALRESWEGEIWDSADAWVQELSGFTDVRETAALPELLREWIAQEPVVHVAHGPWVVLAGAVDRALPHDRAQARDPFDGRPSREQALASALERDFGAKVKDLTPALDALRRVKQPEEIAAMRRASRAGALALAEGIRSTQPGLGEWELESLMTMTQVREGAAGPAYHAIVGSGRNSCVLHYSASARRMQSGEVVLVDYAPELDHYTSDITRTWPVDGRFTPRMAELYDAVLAAQLAGIAVVKPGARLADVERACAQVLRERGFASLVKHGACHSIGMEVHDVPERGAFVPGVAFTIEPGLYEAETGIGIRIEDVVVVTAEGCEVLSSGVPKERAAIEALMAETGWLEQRAPRAAKAN